MIQADANHLFCGRSGLAFECWIEPKELRSTVMTLDSTQTTPVQSHTPRRIIGVGNVGRRFGQATYTLANNHITFKTVIIQQGQRLCLAALIGSLWEIDVCAIAYCFERSQITYVPDNRTRRIDNVYKKRVLSALCSSGC